MADFASMIYGTAQNVAQSQGQGVIEGYTQGVELAQKAESLEQNKVALAQKKEELDQAKIGKIYDYIKDARNYKSPAQRMNYLKGGIGLRNSIGVSSDRIPDDTFLSLASDENMGRLAALDMMYENNEISAKELEATLKDKQLMAKVTPIPLENVTADPDIRKTMEEKLQRKSAETIARERIAAQAEGKGKIDERQLRSIRLQVGDKIQKANIPRIDTALNKVDVELPNGLNGWQRGDKVPGYEGLDPRKDPTTLTGSALKLRQAVQNVQNAIVKMDAGTAVAEHELNAVRASLGLVPTINEQTGIKEWVFKGFGSPEALVNGMKNARDMLRAVESNIAASAPEGMYDDIRKKSAERIGGNDAGTKPGSVNIMTNGRPVERAAAMKKYEETKKANPKDPRLKAMEKRLGIGE